MRVWFVPKNKKYYLSKVVHIVDVERGWCGANEHYTQQNSNIDYSNENVVKAENPIYIGCLFVIPSQTNKCPVHLLGRQLAFCSKAWCLRVSKTESYSLSRICFEMTC
jgi:hypothetical protein